MRGGAAELALAAGVLALGAGWQIRKMRRSPLAAPDSKLACAIFETSGVEPKPVMETSAFESTKRGVEALEALVAASGKSLRPYSVA